MHEDLNFEDKFAESFISIALNAFFAQLNKIQQSAHLKEIFDRATEKTFTDIFDKALWMEFTREDLVSFQQLSINKINNALGFVDMLVEYKKDTMFIFECKSYWGDENEPDSHYWKQDEANAFYDKTFIQANSYMENENSLYSKYKNIYLVVLTFAKVEFKDKSCITKWLFTDSDINEFYGFDIYTIDKKNIGIAAYGKFVKKR